MPLCRRCRATTWRPATSTARLDDLDEIRADAVRALDAGHAPVGVVIGGGLLGLEAANTLRGFGLYAHIVERAPRLMNQQLDAAGGALLGRMTTELGISVHVDVGTESIEAVRHPDGATSVRVALSDGTVDRGRPGDLRGRRAPAR